MLPRSQEHAFHGPHSRSRGPSLSTHPVFILAMDKACSRQSLLDTVGDQSHSVHFPRMQLSFVDWLDAWQEPVSLVWLGRRVSRWVGCVFSSPFIVKAANDCGRKGATY